MSIISDLDNIDIPKITISVVLFLATIAPGFLILYLFKPELLNKLDIIKIIIFSFSLTMPVLAVNSTFTSLFIDTDESNNDIAFGLIVGALVTIISYYVTLFVAYLISWSFKTFIWWLLSIDAGLIIFLFLIELKDKRKRNRQKM